MLHLQHSLPRGGSAPFERWILQNVRLTARQSAGITVAVTTNLSCADWMERHVPGASERVSNGEVFDRGSLNLYAFSLGQRRGEPCAKTRNQTGYYILIPNKKWTAFAVYFPQYFVVVLARRQPCGVLRLALRKISSQIQVYFLSGISITRRCGYGINHKTKRQLLHLGFLRLRPKRQANPSNNDIQA